MAEIFKAQAADIEQIKEIEISAGLSSWNREDYLLEIEKADSLFWVARIEKKTVGFILARLITFNTQPFTNGEIEIYNIAVLSEFRRQSMASELLGKIIEIGQKEHAHKILLEVRRSNLTAQSFYARHGFEVIGKRTNFYTNPLEDAFIMSLDIKSI